MWHFDASFPEDLKPSVLDPLDHLSQKLDPATLGRWPQHLKEALPTVFAASHFVAETALRYPDALNGLIDDGRLFRPYVGSEIQDHLHHHLEGVLEEDELMIRLRRFRNVEMMRIAFRDIAGWADLDETLLDLSRLADAAVQEALAVLYVWATARYGTPLNRNGTPQNLIVLGMGKLGAFELNFSSDIDLIFAFREEGELSDRQGTSHSEFFTKLARRLTKVLDARTAEGYVFRVDTRLRPFGDSGPLVMSFDALDAYYQGQAREWERYAMVKVRAIAGDPIDRTDIEHFFRPFVYRRYLDYRTLGELRDLKRKIAQELIRKDRKDDIKLGPGGIREIEFIGQAFQLIRGGSEKSLQVRPIQEVLVALGALGLLEADQVAQLLTAYRFLRRLENRLQQYQDQQTHQLPQNERVREAIALGMGFPHWNALLEALDPLREAVKGLFSEVIRLESQSEEAPSFPLREDPLSWQGCLSGWGFEAGEATTQRLIQFRDSYAIRRLSARGEGDLTRVLPDLLSRVGKTQDPLESLDRVLAILEAIGNREVYLNLLREKPTALDQLVRLVAASPWVSQQIGQHPLLLDELLDPRTLYQPLLKADLERDLSRRLEAIEVDDLEGFMVCLRQFKQAQVLKVAAADLEGAIPIMVVSDYLSAIAEVLLERALMQSWREMTRRHGCPPGGTPDHVMGFGVIAYGKLGGLELGYGSDLDLVFVYEGDALDQTEGEKPLSLSEFYGRIAKRLIHLFTTNTPAGTLYELDLRLRPSGKSGLLVTGLTAFETYQMTEAWTWEQQALIKARFITGDPSVEHGFATIRKRSLCRERNLEVLRSEIIEMREKMREALGSKGNAVFNIKQDPGGIVDIEFLVQFGVLSLAHQQPDLVLWTDGVRLLESLSAAGFFSADEARVLKEDYCLYREHVHRQALNEKKALIEPMAMRRNRAEVRAIWMRHLGHESQGDSH